MKKLIFAGAIFSLTIVSLIPAVRANGVDCGIKVLHLGDSSATPNYGRFPNTTHDFEVHVVKSHSLSQLMIEIPERVKMRRGIEIRDKSGKKIDSIVSFNGNKATVALAQPISGQTLSVTLNGIQTPRGPNIWLYPISSQNVNTNAQIPLGLARIHVYK